MVFFRTRMGFVWVSIYTQSFLLFNYFFHACLVVPLTPNFWRCTLRRFDVSCIGRPRDFHGAVHVGHLQTFQTVDRTNTRWYVVIALKQSGETAHGKAGKGFQPQISMHSRQVDRPHEQRTDNAPRRINYKVEGTDVSQLITYR